MLILNQRLGFASAGLLMVQRGPVAWLEVEIISRQNIFQITLSRTVQGESKHLGTVGGWAEEMAQLLSLA